MPPDVVDGKVSPEEAEDPQKLARDNDELEREREEIVDAGEEPPLEPEV